MMRYKIVLLDAIGTYAATLQQTLCARIQDLNLDPATTCDFQTTVPSQPDHQAPTVGVLLSAGQAGQQFAPEVERLLEQAIIVIPAVTDLTRFQACVPEALYPTNAFKLDPSDPQLEGLAARVLELLGLLRDRRRLFISYKRTDASEVALQLHQALDSQGYDAFLDTLSLRPADPFQERLWHRMADADVVVLLYTTHIFDSGWVRQEIERANGMKITVLQVIWPDVPRDRSTELFEPYYLDPADFQADQPRQLKPDKVTKLCVTIESLRAQSLAHREAELSGNVCELARAKGMSVVLQLQPTRCLDLYVAPNAVEKVEAQKFVRVVPAIGVPDSLAFQQGTQRDPDSPAPEALVLLYDAQPIAPYWREHLQWLHTHLPVKTVPSAEVDSWLNTLRRR